MEKFVFFFSYYDFCNCWESYIPFEASSIDDAEYALLDVQEYNSKNPDTKRLFCGLDVGFNDENNSCKIMTLDEWFTNRKEQMIKTKAV